MNSTRSAEVPAAGASTPFRFYDNRQKYLAFVTTTNEKSAISRRAIQELHQITPKPPAIRLFDAGMGDATVLANLMRGAHQRFSTLPLYVVAKEISLEDVRLGLERMADRFHEHPATVLVITNMTYAEAPHLTPADAQVAAALNWEVVRLTGNSSHEYAEQIEQLGARLARGWATRVSPKSGNPVYVRPSVLVLYREDQQFLLDQVIPRPGRVLHGYDLVLASQPWRARMSAQFKTQRVLAPLARSLAPGGRLLAIQSAGRDPALEIIQKLWPNEDPFQVDRHQLLAALKSELGRLAREFSWPSQSDERARFRYDMRTMPSEIGDRIGTSTLYAAWNAAIYVNQIEDERLDAVVQNGSYLEATQAVLRKHGGLWFNDESFVVTRRSGSAAHAL